MKNNKKEIIIQLILIFSVTALHYFTSLQQWAIHDFYRRLYYIPIIFGAFKFRLKGGVLVAVTISFLYSPHIFLFWGIENIIFLNQLLEIIMFLFIGSTTGYLVENLYKNNFLLQEQLKRVTKIELLNKNILNSMNNILLAINVDKEIKIINNAAYKFMPELKIGMNILDLKKNEFKEVVKHLNSIISGELESFVGKSSTSYKFNNKSYKIWIYPLKNYNHKIEGAVIIIEDITKMHKLEEEVRRSDKLSSIGVMASGVAHEIRNPLGIVKTIAQTIKSGNSLASSDLEGINIIIEEVDRANSVIKEILDFTKIESGILGENNVYELIEDVKKITDNYSKDKNVEIINLIDSSIKLRIDISKMKQVFMNLIFNAIDAMPNGGKVIIRSILSDEKVFLEVSDNGLGIKEEDIKKVFDPFFTTREVGTGLGLSITYKIVKDHNASIQVKSEWNKGSTFVIEMPRLLGGKNEL